MLQLQPNLMNKMENGHLMSALNCEPSYMRTSVELELMKRLDELDGKEDPEDVAERLEKKYEGLIEQSEFRAALIREIQLLCEQPGTKKELVSEISKAISNGLVEL